MPRGFRSLEVVAQAAKFRLMHTSNWLHGGLRVPEVCEAIWQAGARLTFPPRVLCWNAWAQNCIPIILAENDRQLQSVGINGLIILQDFTDKHQAKQTQEVAQPAHPLARKNF